MGRIKAFFKRWVLAKDDGKEFLPEMTTGSLQITTPDGKTTVSMDLVTKTDERKAQQLTALLLGGSKYDVVDVDNFLGLTD